LNGHVQSAVQQLIEPEPMELDFHPQDLDACDNPSGQLIRALGTPDSNDMRRGMKSMLSIMPLPRGGLTTH
jgi:hypothetical protein